MLLRPKQLQRRLHQHCFSLLPAHLRTRLGPFKPPPSHESKKIADEIYIHLKYHPEDITRLQVRLLYDEHLTNHFSNTLGVKRAIIAYSRPKNIGDYVTQAKLHQAPDNTASTIMEEYELGLNP